MFKKLKEKITEEVKISPQRFQQLTQSVSEKLSATASDENFFSIGDDDANTSNPAIEPGFTNVSLTSPQESLRLRRNSNSSVASDVSFLPRYESVTNMYHLQSDLDVSASELEDSASSSSQLGRLSTEQIYAAFQKAQTRYHKYRGRYTDLARHYQDLERENAKMKSVLVETQDKAIRRVTELKEQSALQQKAKTHLESALRDEIDEKQLKIDSLQTKIHLLQGGANEDSLNKYLTDARLEIESLNARLQETKANAIVFQTKEHEYKTRIANLEREVSTLAEREKENSLSLAQNKMDLHNELVSKDAEISALKQEVEGLRRTQDSGATKAQNTKLIEKIESLNEKYSNYESELRNANAKNASLAGRLQEAEAALETVRDEAKRSLLSLERRVEDKLRAEFDVKEKLTREEFQRKLDDVASDDKTLHQLQVALLVKDEQIQTLTRANEEIRHELAAKSKKYDDLQTNHLQLIDEGAAWRSQVAGLEKELAAATNASKSQIADLERDHETQKREILQKLVAQESELKSAERELEAQRETAKKHEEEVARLKEAIQARGRHLEDKTHDLALRIEDEKLKLLEKVNASEEMARKVEESSLSLAEDLKRKDEEIGQLQAAANDEAKKLQASEESNASLKGKVRDFELQLEEAEDELLEAQRKCADVAKLEAVVEDLRIQLVSKEQEVKQATEELLKKSQISERDQADLKCSKSEVSELRSDIEKLKGELLEAQQKCADVAKLEAVVEDLRIQLVSKEQELKEATEELLNKSRISELDQADLKRSKTEVDDLLGEIQTLKGQLLEAQHKSADAVKLEIVVEDLRSQLVSKEQESKRATEELLTKLKCSERDQADLKCSKSEASELRSDIQKLKGELLEAQQKCADVAKLEAVVEDLRFQLASKEQELKEATEELLNKSRISELDQANLKRSKTEVDDLLGEIQTLKGQLLEAQHKSTDAVKLEIVVEDLRSQLVSKEQESKRATEELLTKLKCSERDQADLKCSKSEASELRSDIEKLKGELLEAQQKCADVAKLEAVVEDLRFQLVSKEQEVKEATEESLIVKAEVKDLLGEIQTLKSELTEAQHKSTDVAKLEAELVSKEKELKEATEELLNKSRISELDQANLKRSKTEVDDLLVEVQTLKEQLLEAQHKSADAVKLEIVVEDLRSQLVSKEQELKEATEELLNKSRISELDQANLKRSKTEVDDLLGEIQTLKGQLLEAQDKCADVAKLEAVVENLRIQLVSKEQEVKEATKELLKKSQITADFKSSKSEASELRSEIEKLKGELLEAQHKCADVAKLEAEVEDLRFQLVSKEQESKRATEELLTKLKCSERDQADLKCSKSEAAELRIEIETLKGQLVEAQHKSADVVKLETVVEDLRFQLVSKEQEKKEATEELLNKSRISELDQANLKRSKTEVEDLLGEIQALKEERAQSQHNLDSTIADLRFRLVSKEQQRLELTFELAQRLEEVERSRTRINQLEDDLKTLKTENDKYVKTDERKDVEIAALSQKLQKLNELIEVRNADLCKLLQEAPLNLHLPNNFKSSKNEDDGFEQSFAAEKENLAAILAHLKRYARLEAEQPSTNDLHKENAELASLVDKLKRNCGELEARNVQVVSDSDFLSNENQKLLTHLEELRLRNEVASRELERHVSDLQHENQLLHEEIQELKTLPVNHTNDEKHLNEIEHLRTKIVQYKSLDLTNRSSIEFYENELQKLKNQNDKLNTRLDETLVTLNHCAELSNSTEIEYLKNVLYNYMLGKESLVLARVIAAVCKFDPHQTELILAKEQQKQTLLGQLGIM